MKPACGRVIVLSPAARQNRRSVSAVGICVRFVVPAIVMNRACPVFECSSFSSVYSVPSAAVMTDVLLARAPCRSPPPFNSPFRNPPTPFTTASTAHRHLKYSEEGKRFGIESVSVSFSIRGVAVVFGV